MPLHQFMTEHREEILEVCRKTLRDDGARDAKLDRDVAIFFEEVVRTLEHHHGSNGIAALPLQTSEAAARLGQAPQLASLEPAKVPLIFGAISSAIAQIGECRELSIDVDAELRSALGNAALASMPLRGADSTLDLFPVQVASVLRRLQASAIPDRAIWITLELDESLHVNADEMQLTSAVGNLLQNALASSRLGGCVTLSCRADEEGVAIEVEDECGGLPPGESTQLLSPRVHGAEQPTKLGLVLAVTRRAVEGMGGSLHVENHVGQGCSVKLNFPFGRPSRKSGPPPA